MSMTAVACMAMAIFFEARSEPVHGQIAVGNVIMNRVESPKFPNTVCEVVWQRKQFSFTHDGKSDNIYKHKNIRDVYAAKSAINYAEAIIEGYGRLDLTSTHYHTTYVNPYWNKGMQVEDVIGSHIFYKNDQ